MVTPNPEHTPPAEPTPKTDAEILAERREALRIAGITEVDPRTVARAMRLGLESIKTLRVREVLRPHVEALVFGSKP